MALSAGTTLGRYRILSLLGSGGMGTVHLAVDTQLERKVALKVLPDEVAGDRSRLERFVREAKAASALNHPNILTVYEIGTESGTHFIATELVEGCTIREWVQSDRPSLLDVLGACSQAATALAAAHEAGIVHRDVKPENVMLRRDRIVKVLDFGLAKVIPSVSGTDSAATEPPLTLPGTVMGTARYMSPEQACGYEVDARTDVWSLGIVLYELLAGRAPFTGATPMHTFAAIVANDPAPLEQFVPELPEELSRIVAKALRKRLDERYPSAAELAQDVLQLKAALEHERRASGGSGARGQVPTGEHVVEATRQLQAVVRSSGARVTPTNLAPAHGELIGRERELDAVRELLARDGVRLVTLTGPGGTGKTTLAYEVARSLLDEYPDGVFAVELAELADPEIVASEIARAVGAKELPGISTAEALRQRLEGRRVLLVLDNFEHLLAAAPLVGELLAAAPRLKALVTSRALLRLRLERELAVEPLELPRAAAPPSADELSRVPAVALFVARAQEVRPAFTLTAENASAVAEICRRLDGLPLAIELAAARMKMISAAALLARLDGRLAILTGGARDLPERQQTMRGAIQWSYDLLGEGERRAFEHLAVFAGGCTLEAAEAVVELEPGGPAGATGVLDALTSLVETSLVRRTEQADGDARFRQLEVVREFALERLREGEGADAVERRHADYFLALGEVANTEMGGVGATRELERLGAEHDNLRAALRWLLENDVAACLRLCAVMRSFWDVHCHYAEGRSWLDAALERGAGAPAGVRAAALYAAGHLAQRQGELAAARAYSEESLRVATEVGDQQTIACAHHGLGTVAMQQNDLETARTHLEATLARAREVGDNQVGGTALNGLGEVARMGGDWAAARPYYEQALALMRQAGSQVGVSVILCNLGAVSWEAGDSAAAGDQYAEALALARALGDKAVASWALDGLAAVAAKRGDWPRAARLAGVADALREAIGASLAPTDQDFRERYLAVVRAALDDASFDAAWRAGRKMSLDEAAEAGGDADLTRT